MRGRLKLVVALTTVVVCISVGTALFAWSTGDGLNIVSSLVLAAVMVAVGAMALKRLQGGK